jgi:uncharacterized protein YdaU (DUF1376 family)
MAEFPCFPLWTDAWIADTSHLTCEQEGLYLRLCYTMWRTSGCRVPNDHAWLIQHLRLRSSEADQLEPIIREYCTSDGNWLIQKRAKREFVLAFERKGRLSALHKRRKNKGKNVNGSRSSVGDDQEQSRNPNLNPKKERKEERACGESDSKPTNEPLNPPRSLATALPMGALAHSAETESTEAKQASNKKPEEMTLTEINQRWRGAG